MKETVAIFGDSFAYSIVYEEEIGRRTLWADVLKEKYEVTNYGRAGSNLYFSYTEFLKHQHLYDHIVFVITCPGRIWLSKKSVHKTHKHSNYRFISNYYHAKGHLAELGSITAFYETIRSIEAACNYFLYVQDLEYETCIHNLLIKEIINVRQNTILIPAFEDSWTSGPYKWSMRQIMEKEEKHWGFNIIPDNKYKDYRTCHMTEENNIIFADVVSRWIEGESINFNIDEFVTPSMERYVIPRKKK
jgi:hypothetical protein